MGKAPPAPAIFVVYVILGSLASFCGGRTPGELPTMKEMAFPTAVLCGFAVLYSLLDVMGVGIAKQRTGMNDMPYKERKADFKVPELVYLAERAQMNQVEQFTSFIIATLSFAFFVNGRLAGFLASIYTILRFLYTSTYRKGVGKDFEHMGLIKFTVPCYFILNGMACGTVVQALRLLAFY
mmetsp:Transcript_23628/g.55060  ORF Transcript_23628/g.55060 Transcript_23628/m.55060 type:complete len:181 (+) Transcript_23628:84-626(+)